MSLEKAVLENTEAVNELTAVIREQMGLQSAALKAVKGQIAKSTKADEDEDEEEELTPRERRKAAEAAKAKKVVEVEDDEDEEEEDDDAPRSRKAKAAPVKKGKKVVEVEDDEQEEDEEEEEEAKPAPKKKVAEKAPPKTPAKAAAKGGKVTAEVYRKALADFLDTDDEEVEEARRAFLERMFDHFDAEKAMDVDKADYQTVIDYLDAKLAGKKVKFAARD